MSRRIAAVSVNHNTSLYMELMLRSLFANHRSLDELGVSLTILDNESEDDAGTLREFAARVGVPILPSGFSTHTKHVSHGEVLRRFVLDRPEASGGRGLPLPGRGYRVSSAGYVGRAGGRAGGGAG